MLASSFGFLCPVKVEHEKKESSSLKPDETATTLPLLSSVLSHGLPEKTKKVTIIYFKFNENSLKKLYYLL